MGLLLKIRKNLFTTPFFSTFTIPFRAAFAHKIKKRILTVLAWSSSEADDGHINSPSIAL